MSLAEHWDHVYRTKAPDDVSWFQPDARLSREMIIEVAPDRAARIVDVGGGASLLVDGLLHAGYRNVTVFDLSPSALELAQTRLGPRAADVRWLTGDVLTWPFEPAACDVWHDRAAFHFLTSAEDRARYVAQLRGALRRGGHAIVATFADDGPMKCSGLTVSRYSASQLSDELGAEFKLLRSARELHLTPGGSEQAFTYGLFAFESR